MYMRQPRCSHRLPSAFLPLSPQSPRIIAPRPSFVRSPAGLCFLTSICSLLSVFVLLCCLFFSVFFLCIIGLLLSNSFFLFFVSYARTHVISLLFFVCFLFYCFIFSASSARRALFGRRVCQWGWVVSIVEEVEIEIESESVFCLVRVILHTFRCRCEALERGHQLAIIRIYK